MTLTCGCDVTVTAPARIERPCEQHGRISLRDHFAGQALVGTLANNELLLIVDAASPKFTRIAAAEYAYAVADAMLVARESGQAHPAVDPQGDSNTGTLATREASHD